MKFPLATMKWYCKCKGKETEWFQSRQQEYSMESRLNNKDLACIKDVGTKDSLLNMVTPHVIDMSVIKKENSEIATLEDKIKECSSTYFYLVYCSSET